MGKQAGRVFLPIGPIKMFPIPASAGVKHDHQGDHLATASPGLVARGMFLNGLSEFKTACVDEAENLSNFSGGQNHVLCLYVFERHKLKCIQAHWFHRRLPSLFSAF